MAAEQAIWIYGAILIVIILPESRSGICNSAASRFVPPFTRYIMLSLCTLITISLVLRLSAALVDRESTIESKSCSKTQLSDNFFLIFHRTFVNYSVNVKVGVLRTWYLKWKLGVDWSGYKTVNWNYKVEKCEIQMINHETLNKIKSLLKFQNFTSTVFEIFCNIKIFCFLNLLIWICIFLLLSCNPR